MATITQKQIFGWEDVEILGDLERLRLLLEHIPDNTLMEALEKERGNGRDDYPIRPMWNSILAGVVYQHQRIESLGRELMRNGQLRATCGFGIMAGVTGVPPSWAYTRFLAKLNTHKRLIDEMFERLVRTIATLVPDFGRVLAIDGKQLTSYGKPVKDELIREKGDGTKIIVESWDSLGIKPIIDIRNCWKDGEKTKGVDGLANVIYDYKGTVSCVCLKTGEEHEMAYGGFENDRQCHKYLCPADHLGMACKGKSTCPISQQVRIPLACDRRIFTPVARSAVLP